MGSVGYKEKTYEMYFFGEMCRKCQYYYCPDQVDEKHLGFDGAFFAPRQVIWELMNENASLMQRVMWAIQKSFSTDVLPMSGQNLDRINIFPKEISERLPKFSCNLFIQYKKPEYLISDRSSHWADWKIPYYRFKISNKKKGTKTGKTQHEILLDLQQKLGNKAEVVYAAPFIKDSEELFESFKKKEIIKKSHIAKAEDIGTGHNHFTYTDKSKGKAHSYTKDIESKDLETILKNNEGEHMNFVEHTLETARGIYNILPPEKWEHDFGDTLSYRCGRIIDSRLSGEFDGERLDHAFIVIGIFSKVFNVDIFAFGDEAASA